MGFHLHELGASAVLEGQMKEQMAMHNVGVGLALTVPDVCARDAAPKLTPLLEDGDRRLRQVVAEALGAIGEASKEVVEALSKRLREDDDVVPVGRSRALAGARPDLVTFAPWTTARHTKEWNVDPELWDSLVSAFLRRVVR